MARTRVFVAIGLVSCVTLAGWAYAQTSASRTPVLTAQDYNEITQLYARLYRSSDSRELDMWLSNFADDGVFRFPNGSEVAGKKALSEWRAKTFAGKTGDSKRRHWTGGLILTPNPDGTANAQAYWLMVDVNGKQPLLREHGTFDDVFVRTAAGWKFKKHAVSMDARAE